MTVGELITCLNQRLEGELITLDMPVIVRLPQIDSKVSLPLIDVRFDSNNGWLELTGWLSSKRNPEV